MVRCLASGHHFSWAISNADVVKPEKGWVPDSIEKALGPVGLIKDAATRETVEVIYVRSLVFAVLTAAASLSASATLAQGCSDLEAQGRAAFAAADDQELSRALADATRSCLPQADTLRQLLAGLRFNKAVALFEAKAPVARQEAALQNALEVMPLWQAHAALGDIAAARDDHAEATRQYQDALDAIASPSLTPAEPPETVIAQVFRKAQTSRLLAPNYVPTTRSTRGEPGGLAAPAIRSFGVTRVALPIQFHFDSTDFTTIGEAAAADLADYLRVQGADRVTLVGHADPVGAADYNRRLSLRRAEALRDYLRSQGLRIQITVDGRGHDEPFQPAIENELNTDQLHQMHRRVELLRD